MLTKSTENPTQLAEGFVVRTARGWGLARKSRTPWVQSRRKRTIDVTLTWLAMPVAMPLAGAAAIGSALAFRSNPFFKQERRGRHGEKFFMYKVRSLPSDFPALVGKHGLDQVRLPFFSRVIRASHADELPQLINVLRGEMSLVGPRPMIEEVLAHVPADLRAAREKALPGMTGVWQVSSMGGQPLHRCPDLDVMYVEHGSLALDIRYMYWTVARRAARSSRAPHALREQLRRYNHCSCVGCRPVHPVPEPVIPTTKMVDGRLVEVENDVAPSVGSQQVG